MCLTYLRWILFGRISFTGLCHLMSLYIEPQRTSTQNSLSPRTKPLYSLPLYGGQLCGSSATISSTLYVVVSQPEQDEKYYLRSLGEDPRKDIADISKQFPELAEDIRIPEFFEKDQFFSSVFRISSPGLQLWTHYDVMDNLLIQVTGTKRVVLYSPRDAPYLYLSGDKSEVLDVDNPDLVKYPLFSQARRYECTLQAGDVLFIPALWFHNTVAEEFGVGVNVFWRHLPSDCYDKTDTYGNKDPTAASRAVQILDRALKTLDELPEEYKDFYARKMVVRIQNKAYSTNYE
ncbi:tRNA wybutosine-synthesizing protein 5 isoform X3 [Ranitomeya imitator]|uniref:tRNA wybutosine-synthesizing protein 5 isoform X3 n=1 Tax=Ranitomeya imitator TaxID=111125 RepID=UPI0037E7C661